MKNPSWIFVQVLKSIRIMSVDNDAQQEPRKSQLKTWAKKSGARVLIVRERMRRDKSQHGL